MLGPFTTAAKFLTALDRIDFNRGGFDGQGSVLVSHMQSRWNNVFRGIKFAIFLGYSLIYAVSTYKGHVISYKGHFLETSQISGESKGHTSPW